jgi:3-deoxy-D-manno-octulosonic-acid transferase
MPRFPRSPILHPSLGGTYATVCSLPFVSETIRSTGQSRSQGRPGPASQFPSSIRGYSNAVQRPPTRTRAQTGVRRRFGKCYTSPPDGTSARARRPLEHVMRYLLNLIYLAALALATPWLIYACLRKGKYREGLAAKLLGLVPRRTSGGPCVWLHAVSVGEINLLGTLIESLERELPGCDFVISTTTNTGYALAKSRYAKRIVFYCPLDFSWAVRKALLRIRPTLLVLAETEIWPNMIEAAKTLHIPVAIVNGRMSDRSARGYQRFRAVFRPLIKRLDLIAVQTQAFADGFASLGGRLETIHVTGSVKFDRAVFDRDNPHTRRLARLAGVTPDDRVFLAGSTQAPEEQLALDAFRSLAPRHPALRLVLVPRHPDRFDEVAALLDRSGVRWQRRTALEAAAPDPLARVLLVDTIGELGAWWGVAHMAYVGGSMTKRGGQNMIEPAAYGAAVSFGPNTTNFRSVVAVLLEGNGATVVHDGDELRRFVEQCLDDPGYARTLGENARRIVLEQQGAVQRTTTLILSLLTEVKARSPRDLAA